MSCRAIGCEAIPIPGDPSGLCDPCLERKESGAKVPLKRGRPTSNHTLEEKAAAYDAYLEKHREQMRKRRRSQDVRGNMKASVKQANAERLGRKRDGR